MSVTLFGYSDDLVEIEGDVREEFNPTGDEPVLVTFSTGTVASIQYTAEGAWRIIVLEPGTTVLDLQQCPADDEDDYTDRLVISSQVEWVVATDRLVRA